MKTPDPKDLAAACWSAAGRLANRQDADRLHAAGNWLISLEQQARQWQEFHDALASELETARGERAEANRVALRFANREAHFARILAVADGAERIEDWATAIGRVIACRDAAVAMVGAKCEQINDLQREIAELMSDASRGRV